MNNISNKTVIITGGSQGIGLEISKHLANTNYKIILISRSKDELEKVCNELDGINKLKNFYFVADDKWGNEARFEARKRVKHSS